MKVANPQATRYAYGIWVYVNTWNSNIYHTVFSRANNMVVYLDKTTPTLICKVTMSDGTTQSLTITDNFPLQKWVFVTVSIDNTIADIYLDGKLVKSVQIAQVNPDDSSNVIFGKEYKYDIYIADLKRYTEVQDPQSVWNTYMKGNGGSVVNKVGSSYAVNLSILKDDVEWNKFNLW